VRSSLLLTPRRSFTLVYKLLLDPLAGWTEDNCLIFNVNKFEVLLHCGTGKPRLLLHDRTIPVKKHVTSLGVKFNATKASRQHWRSWPRNPTTKHHIRLSQSSDWVIRETNIFVKLHHLQKKETSFVKIEYSPREVRDNIRHPQGFGNHDYLLSLEAPMTSRLVASDMQLD
jgi:hypothetical protein